MRELEIGDYAYIYHMGFKVTGIIIERNYSTTYKPKDPNEYDYWNYWYRMRIDDPFILENFNNMEIIGASFHSDTIDGGEFIYKTGYGNDFDLDIERIREERLKKILDK